MAKRTKSAAAIAGECLCGAVTITAPKPEKVTQCNCSACRRYGTLWAYYTREHVEISAPRGGLVSYVRRPRGLRFVRCKTCGCMIAWEGHKATSENRFGLNTRLLDHVAMADVPIKVLDGDGRWATLETYTKPGIWRSPKRRTP